MTHDPYTNRDPLDPTRSRAAGYADLDRAAGGPGWGWILGGIAALVLLFVLVFEFGNGEQTASNTTMPPAATQSAPPAATATRPAPPQENTGAAPERPPAASQKPAE